MRLEADGTGSYQLKLWRTNNSTTILASRSEQLGSGWSGQLYYPLAFALDGVLTIQEYREILSKNGIGQRTGMLDGSGGTAWSYDSRGRLTSETKTVTGSGLFRTQYGYNTADMPAWMKYPGDNAANTGEKVTYGYNTQGALSILQSSLNYYYVPLTIYDAAGRVRQRMLGADNLVNIPVMTTAFNYNAWTSQGGRLQSIVTSGYQNLAYSYDNSGNITTILDAANSSQKQCFGYDNLNRLTSAKVGINDDNCTGATGNGEYADETYGYHPTTGNLDSKTGMGSYVYDTTHKHAVVSTSAGGSYQYDANGNMTYRNLPDALDPNIYDYAYDAENRLVEARKNGSVVTNLTYDGDGKRVKSVQGSTTTTFVGGYFEWSVSTSTMVKYYQAGGQTVAIRTGSGSGTVGLKFSLSDHLGSTSVTVNADLTGRADQLYKPWGESRYTSGTLGTKYTYTGQYSYATTATNDFGLMYYNARFYDPMLGRFSSADTLIPEASQGVQSWDRYAGMNNNTVRYKDSSGHCIGPLFPICFAAATFIADHVAVISTIAMAGALFAFVGPSDPDPLLINNPEASQKALDESVFQAMIWLDIGKAALDIANLMNVPSNSTAAESGNKFHYDNLNGGKGNTGPTQLQNRYSNTEFDFARRGQSGPDVEWVGGSHPSTYPNSQWPEGFDFGDFKPNTLSGMRTFYNDLNSGKFPVNTIPLPYDPKSFILSEDYNFGP